jgi:anti-sigma factor RsiW
VNDHPSPKHLSAETLQALLDGELSDEAGRAALDHVHSCSRCASELESWRVLFQDLDHLPAASPSPGFAARVMQEVAPQPTALGGHLAADVLQDFADGVLPTARAARVQAHLDDCAACARAADAWGALVANLGTLPVLEPSRGFADRVMAGVALPERLSLAARVRDTVAGWIPSRTRHPSSATLQDLADGALAARAAARWTAHVEDCGRCADELGAWAGLAARLGSLERLAPSAAFADAVMAEVRVSARAPVAAPQAPLQGLLAAFTRLLPRTREAWAALSGAALTPLVVSGVGLYAVFSHPAITLGSLVSFLEWKLADVAVAAWGGLASGALQSPQLFDAYSLLGSLTAAPGAVLAGVAAYAAVAALSARVVYRHVFSNRPSEVAYAHVQAR